MASRLKRYCPAFRTLHIYLSLSAFVLLLLFTVTGWLMVHQERLGLNQVRTSEEIVSLQKTPELLESARRADLLVHLGLSGRLVSNEETYFQIERPGLAILVELDPETFKATVIRETRGLSGRFFDLHRNRNGGPLGTWIQDLTAVLCLTVSLSGLLLWIPLTRRRKAGWASLALGLVAALAWTLWG